MKKNNYRLVQEKLKIAILVLALVKQLLDILSMAINYLNKHNTCLKPDGFQSLEVKKILGSLFQPKNHINMVKK